MPDEFKDLDPRELNILDERATATYDADQREALVESIRIEGVRVPLDVFDIDGQLIVADGFNRATIAEELGLAKVPCRVRKGSLEDAMLWNLTANHVRGKNKPGEMARLVVKLRTEHEMEADQIAKRTGLSVQWIRRLLALEDATPTLLLALDNGHVSLGVALELVQIVDNDAQLRALVLAQQQGWSVATARLMVPAILDELAKPPIEQKPMENVAPPGVVCQLCVKPHPAQEMKGALVCEGCWGLAIVSVRDLRGEGGA